MGKTFNIGVILEVVNKFTGPLLEAKKQMDSTTKATKDLVEISEKMQGQGKKLAITGAAIVGAFALPTKAAADFQSELATLKSISGAVGPELETLRAKALELGPAMNASPEKVVQGLQELASAGLNTRQMLDSIRPTLLLAQAGNMQLGAAAEATSGIMNSFQIDAARTGHVVDVMAQAANVSALKIGELGPAIGVAGAGALAANQSLEETVAVLGALKGVGLDANSGATAIRASLDALLAPTAEARKIFDALGIQTRDSAGKMLPLTTVFENIQKGMQGLPLDVADLFKDKLLGGTRGMVAFNAVMGTGAGKVREMRDSLVAASGTAEAFARNNRETLGGSFAGLNAQIQKTFVVLGTELLPAVTAVVNAIGGGVKIVAGFVEHHRTLTKVLAFGAIGFGLLLTVLGGTLFVLGSIGVAIPAVITGFAILKGVVLMTTGAFSSLLFPAAAVLAVLAVFTVLAAGAYAWVRVAREIVANWASLKLFFSELFATLGTWFSEAGGKLVDTFAGGLIAGVERLKKAASTVLGAVRDFLPFSDAKAGPLADLTLSGRRFADAFGSGIEEGEGALTVKVEKTLTGVLPAATGAKPGGAAAASGGGRSLQIGRVEIHVNGSGSPTETAREIFSQLELLAQGTG